MTAGRVLSLPVSPLSPVSRCQSIPKQAWPILCPGNTTSGTGVPNRRPAPRRAAAARPEVMFPGRESAMPASGCFDTVTLVTVATLAATVPGPLSPLSPVSTVIGHGIGRSDRVEPVASNPALWAHNAHLAVKGLVQTRHNSSKLGKTRHSRAAFHKRLRVSTTFHEIDRVSHPCGDRAPFHEQLDLMPAPAGHSWPL